MTSVLRVEELEILINSLKSYAQGAQLQEISLNQNYLLLQHHLKGPITLGIELRPLAPRIGYFFGEIPKSKYLIKPIVLFLRAHARNLRLTDLYVDKSLGRVIRITYTGSEERECHLEIRLFPHGQNIIVKSKEKSISLFIVKEMVPSTAQHRTIDSNEFNESLYLDDWMNCFLGKDKQNKKNLAIEEQKERKTKKEIAKKELLIDKLCHDLEELNKPWLQVGEFLKTNQSLSVPEEWSRYIDLTLSLGLNMQLSFEKYKKQESRKEQIKERVNHLKSEIFILKRSFENPLVSTEPTSASHSTDSSVASSAASSTASSLASSATPASLLTNTSSLYTPSVHSLAGELLSKAKAKGRKLKLSENIEAVYGKSAKDNLALLRKAQPWDLWLHLKDLPGSHLIIRRQKNKPVDQHFLLDAAKWLLNETLGKKKMIKGDRYHIIVTECRYVKPIKGDRLGRVNYQNESTLTVRID